MEDNIEMDSGVLEAIKEQKKITEVLTSLNKNVESQLQNLKDNISNNRFMKEHISFLDVKNQSLLFYLMGLARVINYKASGKSLEDASFVKIIAEECWALKKMKRLDKKFKPILEKLLEEMNEEDEVNDSNKANCLNMNDFVSSDEEKEENKSKENGDEDSGDDEKQKKKVGGVTSDKYVIPKIIPQYFDKKIKIAADERKRALNSHLMLEIAEEIDTAPLEIQETRNPHRIKENKAMNERTEYEEDTFTRLQETKQEKHKRKMASSSDFRNITKFDDISAISRKDNGDGLPFKKKKLSQKFKGKKGKKVGKGSFKKKR